MFFFPHVFLLHLLFWCEYKYQYTVRYICCVCFWVFLTDSVEFSNPLHRRKIVKAWKALPDTSQLSGVANMTPYLFQVKKKSVVSLLSSVSIYVHLHSCAFIHEKAVNQQFNRAWKPETQKNSNIMGFNTHTHTHN